MSDVAVISSQVRWPPMCVSPCTTKQRWRQRERERERREAAPLLHSKLLSPSSNPNNGLDSGTHTHTHTKLNSTKTHTYYCTHMAGYSRNGCRRAALADILPRKATPRGHTSLHARSHPSPKFESAASKSDRIACGSPSFRHDRRS